MQEVVEVRGAGPATGEQDLRGRVQGHDVQLRLREVQARRTRARVLFDEEVSVLEARIERRRGVGVELGEGGNIGFESRSSRRLGRRRRWQRHGARSQERTRRAQQSDAAQRGYSSHDIRVSERLIRNLAA